MAKYINKKHLLLAPILCLVLTSYGQDMNSFERLQSSGSMPDDFVSLLTEKVEEDAGKIDTKQHRRDQRIQKEFYLESNFAIKEMISSGSVLFNDPISNYLSSIYDRIKASNPVLQDKNIRFYTCKSNIINAYTTHAGIIYFNVGLIAKLKTEDEIAYIMCHEISHFLKKHNIEQYTFNEKLESNQKIYKKMDWESKMFSKANYSQQHEMEADSLGLVLFANSPYNIMAATDALSNLNTYQLPFDRETGFSKNVFENEYISLRRKKLEPIDSIEVKENELEFWISTHPEIQTRVDSLSSLIKHLNKQESITSKQNRLMDIAQFELCHLFLEKGMGYHAIYCCEALLKKHPNNTYLKSVLAKSLYALSQDESFYLSYGGQETISPFSIYFYYYRNSMPYNPPEIQQIYNFLYDLEQADLNAIAMAKTWDFLEGDTSKKVMQVRCTQLMLTYMDHYKDAKTSFDHPFVRLAESDDKFSALIKKAENILAKEESKYKFNPDKKHKDLPLNVLIISPEYRKFDERKDKSYQYEASENALITYQKYITDNATKAGVDYTLLSPISLTSRDVSSINDIAIITNYFQELALSSPITQVSNKEAVLDLTERYGGRKLVLLGTYSFHERKKITQRASPILLSSFYYPLLPLGIWYAIAPRFKTINYFIFTDLLNEHVLYEDIHRIKTRDNMAALNSSMYYNFLKIKRLPR